MLLIRHRDGKCHNRRCCSIDCHPSRMTCRARTKVTGACSGMLCAKYFSATATAAKKAAFTRSGVHGRAARDAPLLMHRL